MKTTPQNLTTAMRLATATFWILTFGFLTVGPISTTAAQTLRTVVLSGDAVPGADAGVNFSGFASVVFNDADQTAFLGDLTGAGVDDTNNRGVFSEGGGNGLEVVARTGSPVPDTIAGVNFSIFGAPVLNSAGQTAFRAIVTGTEVNEGNSLGIFSEGGGSGLEIVARRGNAVPGTNAGLNFSVLTSEPVLNNAGQTAFRGIVFGPGVDGTNNNAIFSEGRGNGPEIVAREGSPAPGTGANFEGDNNVVVLNDAGQTAFLELINGPGVVNLNNRFGIWSEGRGNGLELVARGGNAAPGTGDGVNFFVLMDPVINSAGQTAFTGNLAGPGIRASNGSGIWSEGGGNGLELVVRAGDAAPGTSAGITFSAFRSVALNDAGQTAFRGVLGGFDPGVGAFINDFGVWSEGGGNGLELVAREGSPAPGTSDGVNFLRLNDPVLNGAGQTAFAGFLTGTGVNATNDLGLFAEDSLGVLTLIARTGDLLDVDDGPDIDLRTIVGLSFPGGPGDEESLNDLGQLAFIASFADGTSGVFVSTLSVVPEPSSALLLLLGLVTGLGRLRNRQRA